MQKLYCRLSVAMALGIISAPSFATNGDQMLGVTAMQWGMAGAHTAAPQDAATVLTNPAGLADLSMQEFRADFGFGILNPPRKVNNQDSDSDYYLMPAGALAYRPNEKLTLGMGMAGLSGMGVDFPDTQPAPGFQSIVTTKQFYKIAPGFGYQVNDKLAVGAALNIDYQSLALATPMFQLPQNQVYGFGATFGLTYKPNPRFTIGASYTTKQEMDEFKWNTMAGTYGMTMDAPPIFSVGLAFKPMPGLLIEADIKHIAFSDVLDKVAFKTPAGTSQMNFGWSDQTVFAIGVQKQVNPKTTVRAGFNYGESPIGPEDVDSNIGSLAVTEAHLTLGLTRQLGQRLFTSLSYAHAFHNEVTSNSGSGNKIELEQNVVNLQMSYRF
ncbi:OmpP1/FadL family transporter [Sedimenticola selenatireducens]|mgnify:CR=1 FL=1|uniref:Long-chain fatty acid ABC transporter n=1 Tax=Sedimenticola selenatireducens TaxID=191960 RepID=A0A2N6CX75_9GAMM|nr:outer membrane protein transport protein [Sedimenticola selenatireducens]PLX61889.1 MAG: long-chain fatty acid ABC transporter [Sedimenticola selenatireducens]